MTRLASRGEPKAEADLRRSNETLSRRLARRTAEAAARRFEPFFSTKAGGMGVGLVFCRTIVERHGGRLWWEAGLKGGAVFRFTAPAAMASAHAA